MTPGTLARRAATRALRTPAVNGAARVLARARGHRLVLVYHRLGPPAPPGCEVVPSVPVDVIRAQLTALGEVADLVTLDEVLLGGGRRPKIAVTFDDDLPSHATAALPSLRALGVPAAFFLSGRALHGLGPYWFQQLEALLTAHGPEHVAMLLGVSAADGGALALACERDASARRRVAELAGETSRPLAGRTHDARSPTLLQPEGIAALSAAGMTVGFHTVEHGVLPGMSDTALEEAVTLGRDNLAAAAGAALRHFAYPHGKADTRSAAALRRAGFQAAWTGRPAPLRDGDDPHLLGRWEPGPLGVDDLLVKLAIRLHRTAPPPQEVSV